MLRANFVEETLTMLINTMGNLVKTHLARLIALTAAICKCRRLVQERIFKKGKKKKAQCSTNCAARPSVCRDTGDCLA